ncbi:MAG: transcriptional regulator PpsR [Pseudomonadota bacterium]
MDDRIGNTSDMRFAKGGDHFSGLAHSRVAEVLSHASDVVLVLDKNAVIKDASFKSEELFLSGARGWTGRSFRDTVTVECEGKVDDLLAEAKNGTTTRHREINHAMIDGDDAPVSYSGMLLNDSGDMILFGHNMSRIASLQRRLMSSQLSMEREVSRLRNAENQYRAMFQLSRMPKLVVDAETHKITDANAAAAKISDMAVQKLIGKRASSLFDEKSVAGFDRVLASAITTTEIRKTQLKLHAGNEVSLAVSHFPQDGKSYIIVQIQPSVSGEPEFNGVLDNKILALVDEMPDAFVLTDEGRHIIHVNRAFCEMINISSAALVEGKLLDTYFERPNVDGSVLIANVKKHDVVRRFASSLRTNFGQVVNVDIAARQLDMGTENILGFWMRPSINLVMGAEVEQEKVSRSNEQIANLVGHMPLKDIVKETTEMIEQLCIETALELTQDNRASAAQMLGVSRQSLYSKLGKDRTKDAT